MALKRGNSQWGSNESYALRYKQIDALRQYFPTLKELQKDSLYEIPVVLPSRKSIILRISLLRDFPNQPPTIQVFPQVVHKYVNAQMYVLPQINEKLMSWDVRSSLGKLMWEIQQKFMQDPPQIVGNLSSANLNGYMTNEPPPPYGATSATLSSTISGSSTSNSTQIPAIPSTFPALEEKTTEELTSILENEDLYKDFFDNLEAVKTMRQLRDELRDGNEELAKKNIARETEIDDLRNLLIGKQDEVKAQKQLLEEKVLRQQQVMQQFSSTTLIAKLGELSASADQESEQIASTFLDGEMEHKEFVKKFMEKRKLFHLRAAKKESLSMGLKR